MADTRIDVVGLRDLQRELRAANAAFPRELRVANLEAAEVVADATRQSFASRGGVAPRVAASVKAMAQQRNASVRVGGARFPYAMGSMFGARTYRQFPPFKRGGYSLFPQIKSERERVVEVYAKALGRIAAKAFPH